MILQQTIDIRQRTHSPIIVVEKTLQQCYSIQQKHHYLTEICATQARQQAKHIQSKAERGCAGRLAGLIITAKDSICTKDVQTRGGSDILQGYVPPYDATVIDLLKKEDAIIIGKTVMDEFGFGSFCTQVGKSFTAPTHPQDDKRVTGGSSGGAAGVTAVLDIPHVALAESTGGSITYPAALCGVIGFAPSFGAISRYGLISYADSLDRIGLMSKDLKSIQEVFAVVAQKDDKDMTIVSLHEEKRKKRKLKMGVLSDFVSVASPDMQAAIQRRIKRYTQLGHDIKHVSMPFTKKYALACYYIIATAEASTDLARYTGLRFGQQPEPKDKTHLELAQEVRSTHLGTEAKKRVILGTFVRMAGHKDAYYLRAARVRTRIIQEYEKLFADIDILIGPATPHTAPTLKETQQMTTTEHYSTDILSVGPALAGLPHISMPLDTEGLPMGIMFIGKHGHDHDVLDIAQELEATK